MTTDDLTGGREVVVTQARSHTERGILRRWAEEHHPGARVVGIGPNGEVPSALGRPCTATTP